jgi:hypothetical protein
MLPEIEALLVLQDKDQLLKRLAQDLTRLPQEQQKAKLKLGSQTATLEAAKKAVQDNEVAIKSLQLTIKTRQETIARLKTQQFETRKNDEYQALGNEVVRYTNEVTKLEDQELELMEKAESLKEAQKVAQEALAATQKRVDEEIAQLSKRHENVELQSQSLKAERAAYAAKLDSGVVETFERIFKQKGDCAVVTIEGSICRGCYMKVAPSCITGAKAEKNITFCSNCGRIVYIAF